MRGLRPARLSAPTRALRGAQRAGLQNPRVHRAPAKLTQQELHVRGEMIPFLPSLENHECPEVYCPFQEYFARFLEITCLITIQADFWAFSPFRKYLYSIYCFVF